MKLHTQRDLLSLGVDDVRANLDSLRCSITRKISMPYGDGTRSNMVNAETDVLPELRAVLAQIDSLTDVVTR